MISAANSSASLHVANALDVLRSPSSFGLQQSPDFLILFAVLEHLLPDERIEVFSLMKSTIENGGAVLIAETPNRIIPFDAHSSQLHFAQSLPPSLATRYVKRSTHDSWRGTFLAMGGDEEALYRCGLGLSYHDFELDLTDEATTRLPFAFTGWSADLLHHQPIQNDEVSLLDYFENNAINAHPGFARYWLEGLLTKDAKLYHTSTKIGRIKEFNGQIRHAKECASHNSYLIDKKTFAIFEIETQEADEFEFILQIETPQKPSTIFVDIDGRRFQLEAMTQPPKVWHNCQSLFLWLTEGPQSVSISASTPVFLRAIVVNGYTRNRNPEKV